jgi:hypothetical protein
MKKKKKKERALILQATEIVWLEEPLLDVAEVL